jgi:dephospho-CoA kinase
MLVVGLTGGMGSGKTTVARLFAKRDIPVIDADEIAHQLVTPGSPASQEIAATFGNELFNERGELDRAALRTIVFSNDIKKKQLEAILHPRVQLSIQTAIGKLTCCYCIVVVPLLLEGGMSGLMDRILVIDCTEQQQVDRVMQRSGLDVSEIHAIMAAQANRQERLNAADDVIDNSGADDTLDNRVEELHQQYLGLCQAS